MSESQYLTLRQFISVYKVGIFLSLPSRVGSVADFPFQYLASVKLYRFLDSEKLHSNISPIE